MDIRRAHDGDLNAVVSLLAAQFQEHGLDVPLDELRSAVAGMLSDPRRGAILLACDPAPVGVAVLATTWTLEHAGLVAWLDELFVVPDRRARGTGRELLRHALEVARDLGCRAVELEVDAGHTRAERLYEREGFAPLPRRRWARRLV